MASETTVIARERNVHEWTEATLHSRARGRGASEALGGVQAVPPQKISYENAVLVSKYHIVAGQCQSSRAPNPLGNASCRQTHLRWPGGLVAFVSSYIRPQIVVKLRIFAQCVVSCGGDAPAGGHRSRRTSH
jgi:hypothetical protein